MHSSSLDELSYFILLTHLFDYFFSMQIMRSYSLFHSQLFIHIVPIFLFSYKLNPSFFLSFKTFKILPQNFIFLQTFSNFIQNFFPPLLGHKVSVFFQIKTFPSNIHELVSYLVSIIKVIQRSVELFRQL